MCQKEHVCVLYHACQQLHNYLYSHVQQYFHLSPFGQIYYKIAEYFIFQSNENDL